MVSSLTLTWQVATAGRPRSPGGSRLPPGAAHVRGRIASFMTNLSSAGRVGPVLLDRGQGRRLRQGEFVAQTPPERAEAQVSMQGDQVGVLVGGASLDLLDVWVDLA